MQEIVHLLLRIVDVVLNENSAFSIPTDQMQILKYFLGHHLVQSVEQVGLLVGAQQLGRQVHFLYDVD